MKKNKKVLSGVLALVILFSSITIVLADQNDLAKEEVIYIMARADGSIKDIYAVNIFNGGEILDYGNYSDIKMLTTNDEIKLDGDEIRLSSSADKVYYQGRILDKEIPWNISIRYFIDGKEYSPEEIAGKSGKLQVRLYISKNEDYMASFYEDFALQTTFLLNTEKARNIVAEGSTEANIGNKKQLLYTVLPNKGLEAEISADVVDFEMDSIEINGIRLNLNIDLPDMTGDINKLQDGVNELDKGANELKAGAFRLKDGGSNLKDGTSSLNKGTISLEDSLIKLKTGIDKMQEAINTLNEKSEGLKRESAEVKLGLGEIQTALSQVSSTADDLGQIVIASNQIKEGVDKLYSGTFQLKESIGHEQYKNLMLEKGLDIELLKENNAQTIQKFNQEIDKLEDKLSHIEGSQGQEANVIQVKEQIKELKVIVQLLTANNSLIGGTETYLNSLEKAAKQVSDGLSELQIKHSEFDREIKRLSDSLGNMIYNMANLAEAINKLNLEYSKLDRGIIEYTDSVGSLALGFSDLSQATLDITNGSKDLKYGANHVFNGLVELSEGLGEFYEGMTGFTNGSGQLKEKTSDIDGQIENKIGELLSSIEGKNLDIESFTSEKNTNVKMLQFVIKTDPIEKVEVINDMAVPEKSRNFLQKLLYLFGL